MATVAQHIAVPEAAEAQLRALRALLAQGRAAVVGVGEQRQELTPAVQEVLVRLLGNMEQGSVVALHREGEELFLHSAAEVLGVSSEFMTRLLDEERIPSRGGGDERRVRVDELLAFREERDRLRREAIDRMARQEVEDGTYDLIVLPEP